MPNMDKVITGIQCRLELKCNECPYTSDDDVCDDCDGLFRDVLELLKKQEPVAPVLVGRMWECGKCYAPVGIFMDDQRDQFCRTCGTKVKWE